MDFKKANKRFNSAIGMFTSAIDTLAIIETDASQGIDEENEKIKAAEESKSKFSDLLQRASKMRGNIEKMLGLTQEEIIENGGTTKDTTEI